MTRIRVSLTTPQDAVVYAAEAFLMVKRKHEENHGVHRTKRAIFEIYNEMTEAIQTGKLYETRLGPPPALQLMKTGTLSHFPNGNPTNPGHQTGHRTSTYP